MKGFSIRSIQPQRGLMWLIVLGLALPGLWWTVTRFEQAYGSGAGWMWLTSLILVGGLVTHLYQYGRQRFTACSTKPQVSSLQISALAAEALGVQLLWYAKTPGFLTTVPLLTWSGWPYIFIIGGLLGLAWCSLGCTCHDEALTGS